MGILEDYCTYGGQRGTFLVAGRQHVGLSVREGSPAGWPAAPPM